MMFMNLGYLLADASASAVSAAALPPVHETSDLVALAYILSAFHVGIQILDRLGLKRKAATEGGQQLSVHVGQINANLAALAQSQKQLADAITALTAEQKASIEVSRARHHEVVNGMNQLGLRVQTAQARQ